MGYCSAPSREHSDSGAILDFGKRQWTKVKKNHSGAGQFERSPNEYIPTRSTMPDAGRSSYPTWVKTTRAPGPPDLEGSIEEGVEYVTPIKRSGVAGRSRTGYTRTAQARLSLERYPGRRFWRLEERVT